MHKLFRLISVASTLVIAAGAHAQMATIKLTAEDMHTIKEIVLKEANAPKVAADDYRIGDQAPANAELRPFPSEVADKVSAIRSHRFFVSGERVFVVDPKDNRIADVVE